MRRVGQGVTNGRPSPPSIVARGSGSRGIARNRYRRRVAGYVAVARVAHADIRWGASTRPLLDRPSAPPPATSDVEDLAGESIDERLSDWWAGVREQFAITTFYLFDPQSWR